MPKKITLDTFNRTVGSFEFDILTCHNDPCKAGLPVVKNVINEIRVNLAENGFKFDDKEFLKRYAESVTNFGTANAANSSDASGIWQLEPGAISIIFSHLIGRSVRTETGTSILANFKSNIALFCNKD